MSQLIPAITGLAPIAAGVGLIALFGRDPKADEHDLSDYHEPAPVNDEPLSLLRRTAQYYGAQVRPRLEDILPAVTPDDDILPPAAPGTNAGGNPIYTALHAEQVIAEQLREQYGTTNPDAIADTMLRQLAAEQVTR